MKLKKETCAPVLREKREIIQRDINGDQVREKRYQTRVTEASRKKGERDILKYFRVNRKEWKEGVLKDSSKDKGEREKCEIKRYDDR